MAVAWAALFTPACFIYDDLPFPEPDRLVIWEDDSDPRTYLTPSDWPGQAIFESIAAYAEPALEKEDGAESVQSLKVTPGLFEVLGLHPLMGRRMVAGESRVVLMGQDLWQKDYDSSPTILGQTLQINGQPHIAVGVLPKFPSFPAPDIQFWIPLETPDSPVRLNYIGRLKEGVSFEQAAQAMTPLRLQKFSVLFDDAP